MAVDRRGHRHGAGLTALKPLLPVGIASFCILAASGCVTYLAAALALNIAGIRSAAIGYGQRRGLWSPPVAASPSVLSSVSVRDR